MRFDERTLRRSWASWATSTRSATGSRIPLPSWSACAIHPSAAATYQEADLGARRFVSIVADDAAEEDEDDDLYWTIGPCPIADYRVRTGDLTTVRMSDVIGRARWHEQAIYRDYFKPVDIENVVDLGLGAGRDWYRSVVLLRERDNLDYSERDRAVLGRGAPAAPPGPRGARCPPRAGGGRAPSSRSKIR